ncbi:hypothetical protein [Streptomyces sp. NPDC091268]|uniref:hypothetical protein n=1 Tax=Streptomyces sp. NPDC091268 TaxID=3365979 RepID=UPI00382167CC
MIKNLLLRGLPALALSALPLHATAAPTCADGPALAATLPAELETTSLFEGIDRIPAAAESRDGYVRTAFKHGNAGARADDGCNTRAEVILEEAVEYPEITPGCKLTGGRGSPRTTTPVSQPPPRCAKPGTGSAGPADSAPSHHRAGAAMAMRWAGGRR